MSFKDYQQLREEEKNSAPALQTAASSGSGGGGGMGGGMSGGAGGAMADAFINLGDLLHKNFSANMNSAFQNRQARNSLAENKREFDISTLLKKNELAQDQSQFNRKAGMSAIDFLANQRSQFMPDLQRRQLKDAYFKG